MPIYAYRCESCGFEKEVLQKVSDSPLTQCPQCGKESLRKQVTAAGFQLKGSGWYVTDFRSGSNGKKAGDTGGAEKAASGAKGDESAGSGGAEKAVSGEKSGDVAPTQSGGGATGKATSGASAKSTAGSSGSRTAS